MIINGDGGYCLLAACIGGPEAQADWVGPKDWQSVDAVIVVVIIIIIIIIIIFNSTHISTLGVVVLLLV